MGDNEDNKGVYALCKDWIEKTFGISVKEFIAKKCVSRLIKIPTTLVNSCGISPTKDTSLLQVADLLSYLGKVFEMCSQRLAVNILMTILDEIISTLYENSKNGKNGETCWAVLKELCRTIVCSIFGGMIGHMIWPAGFLYNMKMPGWTVGSFLGNKLICGNWFWEIKTWLVKDWSGFGWAIFPWLKGNAVILVPKL